MIEMNHCGGFRNLLLLGANCTGTIVREKEKDVLERYGKNPLLGRKG